MGGRGQAGWEGRGSGGAGGARARDRVKAPGTRTPLRCYNTPSPTAASKFTNTKQRTSMPKGIKLYLDKKGYQGGLKRHRAQQSTHAVPSEACPASDLGLEPSLGNPRGSGILFMSASGLGGKT